MGSSFRIVRKTALVAAVLSVYAYTPNAVGQVNITIGNNQDLSGSTGLSSVTVLGTGATTGSNLRVRGTGYYDLVLVNAGGSLTWSNATLSNNLDSSTGLNGRTLTANGAGSIASLTDSVVSISAAVASTSYGGHAFTAAVGAVNGGHVNVNGGTITAAGGKRTVGIQANDGGSIDVTGTTITTSSTFGHAVNAYTTPTSPSPVATLIRLNDVTINTTNPTYADGIQSANLKARVEATDTHITTSGTNSFGAEVFNGATASFTRGSITTSGATAAGLRVYGGALGSGSVTANGTHITTGGAGAVGAVAGDSAEPTAGMLSLTNMNIQTTGANAAAVLSSYGSKVTSGGGNVFQTSGDNSAGVAVSTGGSVSLGNDTVAASGTGSSGVYVQDNGTVALNGTKVQSSGASITSSLTQAGQTQNITAGSGTTLVTNDGTLLQVNRLTAGMDGTVNFTLQAGSTATGNVVDADGFGTRSGATNFTVNSGASWTGLTTGVNLVKASDDTHLTFTNNNPISGPITVGGNSTLNFTQGADISGSVSTGSGTQASFTGTTSIGGGVSTVGSSMAFNGSTTIGQSVTGGTGSTFNFAGPTTISQNLSGSGTTFQFSKGQSTTISGNVQLDSNSVLRGGTTTTPIQIGGNATVSGGATLGGNLYVTGSLSGSGGSLSPGNSVGSQSYADSSGFTGTYDAEINAAGASDLITIRTGNMDLANLGLKVTQENGTGGFVLNHDYTILQTSAGNVVGTFNSVGSSFDGTLVKMTPIYDTSDVKVRLSVDDSKVTAARSGLSTTQNSTLNGVLSVAGNNSAADAALSSTDTQAALNQLSGAVHGSTQVALVSSSGLLTGALSSRMQANMGAGYLPGAPLAQAYGPVPAAALPKSAAYPLWIQAVGNWQSLKGDDGTTVYSRTGGLVVGGDVPVGQGWRVGGALGVTNGRVEASSASSRSDLTSYSAAVYGGNSWETTRGRINFMTGLGYTRHDIDSSRHVTLGGNQAITANYSAGTTQLFTELGYAVPMGQSSSLEPYVGLAYINQQTDSFRESGGSAALMSEGSTDNIYTTTVGLRGRTTVKVGRYEATLMAGAGWRHAAGDINPISKMAFIQGGGSTFNVSGAAVARNTALIDLGAQVAVGKNTAMGLNYGGQFGSGNSDHSGSLYMKIRF